MTTAHPVLRRKWHHDPCPYHAHDEECPVCDDPGCDGCGNPGWACECDEREKAELEEMEMAKDDSAATGACSVCNADEVVCERAPCAYKGPCSSFKPCYGVNDTRCPSCGSTKNAHNRAYMAKVHGAKP